MVKADYRFICNEDFHLELVHRNITLSASDADNTEGMIKKYKVLRYT